MRSSETVQTHLTADVCGAIQLISILRYNIINRYIMFTIVYRYPVRIIMSDAGRCSLGVR